MLSFDDLEHDLRRIDGRGYRAYKDIAGSYAEGGIELHIDHVQGDPFAAPSKLRIRVYSSEARIPEEWFSNRVRRVACEDFLARRVSEIINRVSEGGSGSGKSGLIFVDAGGQQVLERSAVVVTKDFVEARLEAGLPARGRSVMGRQAAEMLCTEIPEIARRALCFESISSKSALAFIECVENQEHIRRSLKESGLVGFVADGAKLPRASGASDRPLASGAVLFESPPQLRVSLTVPNPLPDGSSELSGMGIPKGITLIVGGGYHGKSTVLRALEDAVYPHIPGDGREYVVSDPESVKIRAEDGRSVQGVDISAFINNIPHGKSTRFFSSEDASGSTSQAANIVEALEVGAKVLLIDEDTSATNFMIRDARMQALVNKEAEPITPFIDRVRQLYEQWGVSTILVMGGCGDYFDVADQIIMMKEYRPSDVVEQARTIAREIRTERKTEAPDEMPAAAQRVPLARSFDASRGRREVKIDVRGVDYLLYGKEQIDLRCVEQLADQSQCRAIGAALYCIAGKFLEEDLPIAALLDRLELILDEQGLDCLDPFFRPGRHPGNYARPRRFEVAAALNRLRSLRIANQQP